MMIRPLRPTSWRASSQGYVYGASYAFCYHFRLLISFALHSLFASPYVYFSQSTFACVFFFSLLPRSMSSISVAPVDLRSFYISFFFLFVCLLLNKWSLSLVIKYPIDFNSWNMIFSFHFTTLSISSTYNGPESLRVSFMFLMKENWGGGIFNFKQKNNVMQNKEQWHKCKEHYVLCLQENYNFQVAMALS